MTSTHDAHGRPYAKLSQIKPGDKVLVDDGFECMKAWSIRTVWFQAGDLYLRCSGPDGESKPLTERHSLEGQLQDDGDTLIGIFVA